MQPVKKVVIAGGGTAGWCAAAGLARILGPLIDITLVESDDIGIVGVGESTVPTVRTFHSLLGIDEREFLRATNATYKLGISFEDWARIGDRYIHSFGTIGPSTWLAPFHHLWLQARSEGYGGDLGDYCFELQALKANKFQTTEKGGLNYAYHTDASLYGQFLRKLAEASGAKRIEGKITRIDQDPETGFLTALVMDSGARVEGDLFIDCTGFRGMLIEQTLKTGYDDWSHWLPTNRALAVQTEAAGPLTPYTRAAAHHAGWRWRIPLQNRVGNGLVYCADHMSEEEARNYLAAAVDAPMLFEPRLITYQTGGRKLAWNRNCVAMGLATGFIEPLESTSIHLFQASVTRLAQLFPFGGCTPSLIDRYNAEARAELEKVRDFVILHYKLTERDDSDFWRDRAAMAIPDSLAERIDVFSEQAHAWQASGDLFRVDSWVQVMLGQRLEPRAWHRLAGLTPRAQLGRSMDELKGNIARVVAGMPDHAAFIAAYLAARPAA